MESLWNHHEITNSHRWAKQVTTALMSQDSPEATWARSPFLGDTGDGWTWPKIGSLQMSGIYWVYNISIYIYMFLYLFNILYTFIYINIYIYTYYYTFWFYKHWERYRYSTLYWFHVFCFTFEMGWSKLTSVVAGDDQGIAVRRIWCFVKVFQPDNISTI